MHYFGSKISVFQKAILSPLNQIIIQVARYKYLDNLTLTQLCAEY